MSQLRSLLLILNRGAIMYVKFFDCELFIDSHEIKIKNKRWSSGQSYGEHFIPPNNVKDLVEEFLVPTVYQHKCVEELLKRKPDPNIKW